MAAAASDSASAAVDDGRASPWTRHLSGVENVVVPRSGVASAIVVRDEPVSAHVVRCEAATEIDAQKGVPVVQGGAACAIDVACVVGSALDAPNAAAIASAVPSAAANECAPQFAGSVIVRDDLDDPHLSAVQEPQARSSEPEVGSERE